MYHHGNLTVKRPDLNADPMPSSVTFSRCIYQSKPPAPRSPPASIMLALPFSPSPFSR